MALGTPELNRISHSAIGAAMEVHRVLGPGLLESAYESCLAHELTERRIGYERQKALPVVYKGLRVESGYRIDLLIENVLVVELKAVEATLPVHQAQLLTYLRLGGWKLGLLLNFNVPLLKDGIKRFLLD